VSDARTRTCVHQPPRGYERERLVLALFDAVVKPDDHGRALVEFDGADPEAFASNTLAKLKNRS
jgi:hypothetical protein